MESITDEGQASQRWRSCRWLSLKTLDFKVIIGKHPPIQGIQVMWKLRLLRFRL